MKFHRMCLTKKQDFFTQGLDIENITGELDLCFVVDVTGSMQDYIDGVRDSIFDIVDYVRNATNTDLVGNFSKSLNSTRRLRLAFVG